MAAALLLTRPGLLAGAIFFRPLSLDQTAAAVAGSIIFFTWVIFVAGKPLISACLRIIASSLAKYTQKVFLSATKDSTHWMSGPSCASTEFDFAAASRSCSRSNVPAAGMPRSMM
jgi:hypothetical protein